jgi:hypothetical protein
MKNTVTMNENLRHYPKKVSEYSHYSDSKLERPKKRLNKLTKILKKEKTQILQP